jgi:hypothetical protein
MITIITATTKLGRYLKAVLPHPTILSTVCVSNLVKLKFSVAFAAALVESILAIRLRRISIIRINYDFARIISSSNTKIITYILMKEGLEKGMIMHLHGSCKKIILVLMA